MGVCKQVTVYTIQHKGVSGEYIHDCHAIVVIAFSFSLTLSRRKLVLGRLLCWGDNLDGSLG